MDKKVYDASFLKKQKKCFVVNLLWYKRNFADVLLQEIVNKLQAQLLHIYF